MSASNKYRAKPVFWNVQGNKVCHPTDVEIYRCRNKLKLPEHIIRFDSTHEFKVYLELVRMYGKDRVVRQAPIRIFSRGYCYPNGKNWKVDFVVYETTARKKIFRLVEAKGAFTSEFGYTIAALEACNFKLFKKLVVVFTDKIPKKNLIVRSLLKGQRAKQLLIFKQLEKTLHLP